MKVSGESQRQLFNPRPSSDMLTLQNLSPDLHPVERTICESSDDGVGHVSDTRL